MIFMTIPSPPRALMTGQLFGSIQWKESRKACPLRQKWVRFSQNRSKEATHFCLRQRHGEKISSIMSSAKAKSWPAKSNRLRWNDNIIRLCGLKELAFCLISEHENEKTSASLRILEKSYLSPDGEFQHSRILRSLPGGRSFNYLWVATLPETLLSPPRPPGHLTSLSLIWFRRL